MARVPALAAFVQRRFGVAVQLRERTESVPSTGFTLPGDPNRLHVLAVNHGAIYATATLSRPAVVNRGARLAADGGFAEWDAEVDGEGVGYPITFISSGANVNISIYETVALDQVEV